AFRCSSRSNWNPLPTRSGCRGWIATSSTASTSAGRYGLPIREPGGASAATPSSFTSPRGWPSRSAQ
ncbi:unnamed protein product, partial [Prorocentrum cordatum]